MAIRLDKTKVEQRTSFTPEFITAVKDVLVGRYQNLNRQYQKTPVKTLKQDMETSARFLSEDGGVRTGEEYLKAMFLRQQGFRKFATGLFDGRTFLRGLTVPIIAMTEQSGFFRPYADLGPYEVVLFVDDLKKGVSFPHLIPLRLPSTNIRHYHHKTNESTGKYLGRTTRTCDAGFSHIVSELVQTGDIPQLFNIWYTFLTRYNPSSPLPGCKYLDHEELL